MNLLRSPCDDGAMRARKPATTECGRAQRRWTLAATILGSSMVFIDGSVVNVALPAMQADLRASLAETQWIVNSYALMLGALILAGGAAGDRFGRRVVFTVGLLTFTAASIGCGL